MKRAEMKKKLECLKNKTIRALFFNLAVKGALQKEENMGPLNGAIALKVGYESSETWQMWKYIYAKEWAGHIRIWLVEEFYRTAYYSNELQELVEVDEEASYEAWRFLDIGETELKNLLTLSEGLAEKNFTRVQIGTPDEIQETINQKMKPGTYGELLDFSPREKWNTTQKGSVTIFEKHVYYWWELSRQYDEHEKIAFCPYGKEAELFDLV